jgi:hypothetical protein
VAVSLHLLLFPSIRGRCHVHSSSRVNLFGIICIGQHTLAFMRTHMINTSFSVFLDMRDFTFKHSNVFPKSLVMPTPTACYPQELPAPLPSLLLQCYLSLPTVPVYFLWAPIYRSSLSSVQWVFVPCPSSESRVGRYIVFFVVLGIIH